jgi:hypothetical protein
MYFGPKTEEVRGNWKRLYNLKLHNFPSSPNIIMLLKLLRIGWTRNIGHFGEARNEHKTLTNMFKGRDHLGSLGAGEELY